MLQVYIPGREAKKYAPKEANDRQVGLKERDWRRSSFAASLSLHGPKSMLSQVPKGEAPGAPIFSGCSHFSRHLGHPP
jgi:hypothetical protein